MVRSVDAISSREMLPRIVAGIVSHSSAKQPRVQRSIQSYGVGVQNVPRAGNASDVLAHPMGGARIGGKPPMGRFVAMGRGMGKRVVAYWGPRHLFGDVQAFQSKQSVRLARVQAAQSSISGVVVPSRFQKTRKRCHLEPPGFLSSSACVERAGVLAHYLVCESALCNGSHFFALHSRVGMDPAPGGGSRIDTPWGSDALALRWVGFAHEMPMHVPTQRQRAKQRRLRTNQTKLFLRVYHVLYVRHVFMLPFVPATSADGLCIPVKRATFTVGAVFHL